MTPPNPAIVPTSLPRVRWRNRPPEAIAEIIEAPKIITSPPDIGYWIDTSCVPEAGRSHQNQ
ncbi:hypothetical protein LC612_38940 [Nostoc sp. CHAB 5834]|nr:hypothetical protein [Nostoc sp. CHAB 5834]